MAEEMRAYKDRLFCFIFGSEAHKDWTLSLYNAVNGTAYTNPDAHAGRLYGHAQRCRVSHCGRGEYV